MAKVHFYEPFTEPLHEASLQLDNCSTWPKPSQVMGQIHWDQYWVKKARVKNSGLTDTPKISLRRRSSLFSFENKLRFSLAKYSMA